MILIYGEDTQTSRNMLGKKLREYEQYELVRLDGRRVTLSDVVTATETSSLFSSKRIVVIEGLLGGGKNKDNESIVTYLNSASTEHVILIWESGEISKKIISTYFTKWSVFCSSYPQILFKFLDAIHTESNSSLLQMFHSLLTQRDAGLIYTLLVRQLRLLLIVKDMGASGLSDMQSWQIRKLQQQANRFSFREIVYSYRELLAIDYRIKSGNTPYTLSQLLDIFLVTL